MQAGESPRNGSLSAVQLSLGSAFQAAVNKVCAVHDPSNSILCLLLIIYCEYSCQAGHASEAAASCISPGLGTGMLCFV